MKKVLAILLLCVSLFCIFACNDDKIPTKNFNFTVDEANSDIGKLTADLTLTDLVGEYTIYYGDMYKRIDDDKEPIMKATGGETVHFDNLYIPSGCFSLIIANENGEEHIASIPMKYCSLPDDEF